MSHTPTKSAAKIIGIAKGQVGYHEGRANGHWNNDEKYAKAKGMEDLAWANKQAWCAVFVSWCALQAGFKSLYPHTASTDLGASWFKQQGRWNEYPAVGAQVFYGSNGDMNHTGLVVDFDADYIYTVEGNTNTNGSAEGDGVYQKKRARRDSYVQGYGYPKFPEGIVSADPQWKNPVAAAPTAKTKQPTKTKTVIQRVKDIHDAIVSVRKVRDAAKAKNPARASRAQSVIDKIKSVFPGKKVKVKVK